MIDKRKTDHIRLALDASTQDEINFWDQVRLPYKALPEVDWEKVDTGFKFLGKKLSMPLMIGSMTLSANKKLARLNEDLVRLAEGKKIAFGIGSQRVMIESGLDGQVRRLRKVAPTACLLANFGAVQLNYGWGIREARRCIEVLEADGLILHLNVLQEVIQPEGNKNFAGLLKKIEKLSREVKVPVVVKEVGFGIDPGTAKKLYEVGVYGIDVAGKGGTNWAKIEALRRTDDWAYPLYELGYPAPELVETIAKFKPKDKVLIASGGIRHGLHVAKAVYLGADLVAAAYPFLVAGKKGGYKALVKLYNAFYWQYKAGLVVMGEKDE